MNETEMAYYEANRQIQRAVGKFKQQASIEAYIECKERVLREYLQERYPSLAFSTETHQNTHLSPSRLEVTFAVDIVYRNGTQAFVDRATQELCEYLDSIAVVEATSVGQVVRGNHDTGTKFTITGTVDL